jgi:glycosyltransferase involved in cell wall biosynthesis
LRVLHVHSGNLHGGIETFLATLARHRAEAPLLTMDFALCFEGRNARELQDAGASVHVLGNVRVRSRRSVLAARSLLSDVLQQGTYDVALLHSVWSHAVFAPVIRRGPARLVFYMHDIPSRTGVLDHWANATVPDLILCNSDFTARAGEWLFRAAPRRLVRYPVMARALVQSEVRPSLRASLRTPDDAIVILQASRMQSWKGHRLLVGALTELQRDPRWVCWIAGGAQRPSEVRYEQGLRSAAARAGLSARIRFLGQRDDVPALMRAADVFCQPNLGPEPYGLVFVEALGAGLPVVATRMGGPVEIVNASCGKLVPPDPRSVATALSELLNDDAQRVSMSKAGPARARELGDPGLRLRDLSSALHDMLLFGPRANSSDDGAISSVISTIDTSTPTAHIDGTRIDRGGPNSMNRHSNASRSIRVLHVHSGNLYGGIETYLRNITRYRMHAPSLATEFALCFDGRLARELRDAGAEVHLLGAARVRSLRSIRGVRRALARALQCRQPQVVICHSAWSHALFAPVVKRSGALLVHHMHDIPQRLGWLERWASLTDPDAVLCYHAFINDSGQWLFPKVPRRMIPPPSDLDASPTVDRAALRAAHGASPETVVILHATRTQSWKGQSLLLQSLATLRHHPRWVCWIAGAAQRPGEVSYEQELHSTARRLGISDRVQFLGQRADVAALMRAADVYCQPNITPEPFGQAFVEALAAGLPVVTTNMGGGREVVNAVCGILVAPDVTSVAAALAELIEREDKRAALAKAGPIRARELCDPEVRMRDFETMVAGLWDSSERGVVGMVA